MPCDKPLNVDPAWKPPPSSAYSSPPAGDVAVTAISPSFPYNSSVTAISVIVGFSLTVSVNSTLSLSSWLSSAIIVTSTLPVCPSLGSRSIDLVPPVPDMVIPLTGRSTSLSERASRVTVFTSSSIIFILMLLTVSPSHDSTSSISESSGAPIPVPETGSVFSSAPALFAVTSDEYTINSSGANLIYIVVLATVPPAGASDTVSVFPE